MSTPHPVTQAILAMCPHPAFVQACEACTVRQAAAFGRLLELAKKLEGI